MLSDLVWRLSNYFKYKNLSFLACIIFNYLLIAFANKVTSLANLIPKEGATDNEKIDRSFPKLISIDS